MATRSEHENFDIEEQRARIRRALEESDKLSEEARKLAAERIKFEHEWLKIQSERLKTEADLNFMPRIMVFQAMIATAALLGAGAALAKLFFH